MVLSIIDHSSHSSSGTPCTFTSDLSENRFSGTIDLGNLPKSMTFVNFRNNALNGTVRVPHGLRAILEGNVKLTVERIEE